MSSNCPSNASKSSEKAKDMKPHEFELRIKNAKLAHKNNRLQTCFKNGILTRHLYADQQKSPLPWWDDFGFIINDYRVSVAWCHPRHAFRYFIEIEAIEMVLKGDRELGLDNANTESISKPIYKKVERSRKKEKWYERGSIRLRLFEPCRQIHSLQIGSSQRSCRSGPIMWNLVAYWL